MKLKGKTATTGLLAMGIVILLATLGLVYGNWSQTLSIGGTVTTSGLNAEFVDLRAVENPEDKNVASCDVTPTVDPDTLKVKGVTITIDNAYPNYGCTITGGLQNTGQRPITVFTKEAPTGSR